MFVRAVVITLFLGLCSQPLLAQTYEFEARAKPPEGLSWIQDFRWDTQSKTLVTFASMEVRDRSRDEGVRYVCDVRITNVQDEEITGLSINFGNAYNIKEQQEDPIDLLGSEILATGHPGKRKFKRKSGGRLNKEQKQFLKNHFGGDDGPDPVELLLPSRAVSQGESWDIDIERVIDQLGRDRFELDRPQSYAKATLREVFEKRGVQYGRIDFRVRVVPSSIVDVTIEEALMQLSGFVDIPIQGDIPYGRIEVDLGMRFLGFVKRMGVRVRLDLDSTSRGSDKRALNGTTLQASP